MCTVSYLPLGKQQFILTSNRDEASVRAAIAPHILAGKQSQLLFPKDPLAGGTWICASNDNRMLCLLNGAFVYHNRQTPYRKSRGLVVLDFFNEYTNAQAFLNHYPLNNIEPFTLVIYDNDNLYELKWDGEQKHIRPLDANKAYIWSSATLYTAEIKNKREQWFTNWLQAYPNKQYTAQDIVHFHRTGGEGDPQNDLVMNRCDIVQTVSITNIVKTPTQFNMTYYDLTNGETNKQHIKIEQSSIANTDTDLVATT